MKLPALTSPEKYTGLYVFDFGDQVAVGYTADEIAVLLESEKYADGKVYRIHRAQPDGSMELAGVSRERFRIEDGLLFHRSGIDEARADFEELIELASGSPPPCRLNLQLALTSGPGHSYLTAAIFPAEFTHDVADWLNRIGFEGGDSVEGGPSRVTDYYSIRSAVVDRRQFWPVRDDSRSAQEVLATTHLAIQRIPA